MILSYICQYHYYKSKMTLHVEQRKAKLTLCYDMVIVGEQDVTNSLSTAGIHLDEPEKADAWLRGQAESFDQVARERYNEKFPS